ncbi:hypothetical protein [Sphingomonas immobilis]|uniref:Uncharacterized protein n=1 Tax=Sphingomonas immobilis TaxID=3063997 RepID=A0ABT9A0S7_9SPHN|nr:hypothetical protein [Sphingomonas sp. CA1-15]MDO7843428.1 hypothetical protein [Sphingomonas sp. CA1-15]
MTQALNYTPKAIEALLSYDCPGMPMMAAGMRYLAAKLREAQVFVLQDGGQLLDRSKPRPEVAASVFRPPFPVVALEYLAAESEWGDSVYTQARSTRRIALAWEYTDDFPPELRPMLPPRLGEGVVVASICWFDDRASWIPVTIAAHIAYDTVWSRPPDNHFREEMLRSGRLPKAHVDARQPETTPLLLAPEQFAMMAPLVGGFDALLVAAGGDVMDEANAYLDLCYALACKNVATREVPPPKNLNRQRLKAGKLPLKGFHVLELNGGGDMPGTGGGAGDRSGPRSHLRRGHIRRLSGDRVTWVNSTVVRGRGFVDKVYAA